MKRNTRKTLFMMAVLISAISQAQTWVNVSPPSTNNISWNKIRNVGNYIFTIGSKGTIAKSNDDGINWDIKNIGTTQTLRGFNFFNQQVGVVVGDSGCIFLTKDGGKTWESKFSGGVDPLYDVHILSENEFLVVGGASNVVSRKTSDGGTTWKNSTFLPTSNLSYAYITQMSKLRNGRFFASGVIYDNVNNLFYGCLYESNDTGNTWKLHLGLGTSCTSLLDIYFQDSLFGGFVGENGMFRFTMEGGLSWSSYGRFPNSNLLTSINIGLHGEFFVCDNTGKFYSSKDSGRTWDSTIIKSNLRLNSIYIDNTQQKRWVAGAGEIFVYKKVLQNSTEFIKKEKIFVYPNPAHQNISISLKENTNFQIYNATGQQVYSGLSQGQELHLSIENWLPGVYLIRTESDVIKWIKI